MDIPVFHDDQHGTAIIAAAGVINALHLTGRKFRHQGGGERRRRGRHRLPRALKAMGLPGGNAILVDKKGVIYQRPPDGMNQWKSAHAVDTEKRTLADAHEGRRCFFGLSAKDAVTPDMVAYDGEDADHLRDGQSRSRDHARGSERGARGCDRGHRPFGLSEPGQQCPGLSLYLPRRARRARAHHQRSDEDRRRRSARRARARRRARRSRDRLSRRAARLWRRIHHPGAV